jgi:putative MATE family efflux protein
MTAVAELEPERHETEKSVRVVWALAWPAVALNSLQVVNTLLDRFFIGHLPQSSLTAHGGSMTFMFLMFSLGVSIATGATALVARSYGADEPDQLRKASRQSLSLTLLFSLVLGLVTAIFSRSFAGFILPADDPSAIREMAGFLGAYALGMPAIYTIQTLAGALRGIGDTKSPMVISGFQILLHMILNFFLIFPTHKLLGVTIPGAGLGLTGAATALSISAWMSALGYMFFFKRTLIGSLWKIEMPDLGWAWRIMRIAIPAGVQSVLRVLSLMVFTLILALVPQGSAAIAAMSVAFAIESLMFMPSFGLSVAAGALVGQSLGMGRPDRAEKLAWISAHHAALVTLALVGPIFLGAPWIADLLLEGKVEIVREAIELIRYLCATEVFFAYAMVMIGAMQGAGDTTEPLWIAIASLWGLRVPVAFLLAIPTGHALGAGLVSPLGLGLGATGAWIAMSGTQAVQGVLSILAFRRGRWKTKEV